MLLRVGEIFEPLVGGREETHMHYDETGLLLIIGYNKPKQNEIEQIQSGKEFKINFVVLNDVIYFTAKIGSLNWLDAPYTPHLDNANWQKIESTTKGYALTIILVDVPKGIIKSMRFIGLGNVFSQSLYQSIKEIKNKPFLGKESHIVDVNNIMNRYKTPDLARLAPYKNRYMIK